MLQNSHRLSFDKKPKPYLESNEDLFKNPFCPFYRKCLNKAVIAKWPQFTCSKCNYRNLNIGVVPNSLEKEGYYTLLKKVFNQE